MLRIILIRSREGPVRTHLLTVSALLCTTPFDVPKLHNFEVAPVSSCLEIIHQPFQFMYHC